jgi:hypothetical protein
MVPTVSCYDKILASKSLACLQSLIALPNYKESLYGYVPDISDTPINKNFFEK